VVTERLSIEFGGNWYYKIFGRIVLRNKLIFLLGSTKIFWEIVLLWVGQADCFEFCGNWYYEIFGRIVLRNKLIFVGIHLNILGDCFVMGGDRKTVN
jgi:hypothetical protein